VPFTYFAQHDPRWAEATGELDPASFHPERLMTKEGAKPGWLMPFGHGPRFCIGGGGGGRGCMAERGMGGGGRGA
jgi:cytochrome P450